MNTLKQPIDNGRETMSDDEYSGLPSKIPVGKTGGRMTTPWFCVWTKPGLERLADHSLRADGFPTYLPLHATKKAIEPLFPRYMFASVDENGQWVRMLFARGVSGVLRNPAGVPHIVPSMAVERLLEQCAPNGVIYPVEPAEIRKDTNARALVGPLSGFTGICTRTTRDRVWLLLNLLGRPTEVAFSREAVEAA